MATQIKPQAKIALVVIGALVVIFGLRLSMQKGWVPTPGIMKSIVASKVDLPSQSDAQVANVTALPYPTSSKANVAATRFPVDIWEWNAYYPAILGNGGIETTKGSLMEKYGVNLVLHREDSNAQMKADLLACAKQLHDGEKTCSTGAAAIIVMGDGAGQWLADLNPQLKKLGPDYIAEIIGATGRSNGEDALLGPAEWKTNPKSMLGKTIVGVIRDGDWNIALNYEGSNNLKNNPDLKTYDPDAVNWISAPDEDYIKAVTEVYNPNRCEDRKEVKDGRPTGKIVNVCPDGVVTWTPGDEQAVHGPRAGTTKIISSKQYAAQMPAVVIGIKKFFNDNRDEISGFFAATFQAADQIKAFDGARKKAGEISAIVYKDQTGDYWYQYYTGVKDQKTGQPLGGSAAFNLDDNVNYFGLDGKHNNNMRATYETFGKIATQNYPDLFKTNPIPPYKEIVDTSFILGAQAKLNTEGVQATEGETVDYEQAQGGQVVGHEAVYISFNTGSDQPTSAGLDQLRQLRDSLAVNSALALQIDGYTDNSGSDTVNIPLSQRRALAVKQYLQKTAGASFPNDRFKAVEGHGSQSPIGDNKTAAGKEKNRRVEITQIGG
jgi:outer membrane protein OmpA-like peptidoglycan-associated protein/NAD-dependent dihydropyrimidine dehydrogenase PreA subunit